MVLFDVKKYETPDAKDVDMEQTKHNVSVFLSAYLAARCRVGQPREPKVTVSFWFRHQRPITFSKPNEC